MGIQPLGCGLFLLQGDVCSCYSVMQELQMKCGNISNSKISQKPSPYHLSRTKSITSAVRSIKRKRLRFHCDQNCDEHDEKRLRRWEIWFEMLWRVFTLGYQMSISLISEFFVYTISWWDWWMFHEGKPMRGER